MTPLKSHRKRSRGQAVLEFAISFALLWLMFGGLYQFGYSFFAYNRLLTAVNNAAELGSKMTYDTGNSSSYTTALKNMVLYGNTTAGSSTIVPGLAASNVGVSMTMQNSIPVDVTVSITGFSVDALFTTFTFNGKPRVTAAYMGSIACSGC